MAASKEKSEVVWFGGPVGVVHDRVYTLGSDVLRVVRQYRYLGLTYRNDLLWGRMV